MANNFPTREILETLFELTQSGRLEWSQLRDNSTSALEGLKAATQNHTLVLRHYENAPGNISLIVADAAISRLVYTIHGMHISTEERTVLSELWRTALESQPDPSEMEHFQKDLAELMANPGQMTD